MNEVSAPQEHGHRRSIRHLAVARFLATFAATTVPTAFAFAVIAVEGSTSTDLGVVVAAGSVGLLLFIIPAGVAADRRSRRRIMVGAEVASGTVVVVAAGLMQVGAASVLTLAMTSFLSRAINAFFHPAFTGLVPELVAVGHLQAANAQLRTAMNLGRIGGSTSAGFVVAAASPAAALAAGGMTSLLAAVTLASLGTGSHARAASGSNSFHELRAGWREFRRQRWVVAVVAVTSFGNLGTTATLGVLGPLQSERELGGASAWAVISGALAIGTLVGAPLARSVRPIHPLRLGVILNAVVAIPIGALAVPAPLVVIACSAFAAGVSLVVFVVLWDTQLQAAVPGESLSRVSAFEWLGSFALSPVALGLAGPLSDGLGTGHALALASAVAATSALGALAPAVRNTLAPTRAVRG